MVNVQSTSEKGSASLKLSDRRLYLAGGLGGLLSALAWLVQPLLVFAVASAEEGEYPTVEYLLANPWYGPVEAAVFTGIGIGLLLLVIAVAMLIVGRADATSAMARLAHVMGVLAGCTWVLLAGWYLAPFTSVGEALADAAPDVALQQAALQIHNIGATGLVLASGLAFAVWLLGIATVGRAHGVIGRPLTLVAFAAAIVLVLPMVMPFSPPWGVIGQQIFAFVAGVAFLLKARNLS